MARPAKTDVDRSREVTPTGIRIPLDLRAALEREAGINGRTLSGEIIRRLKLSLEVNHVSTVLHTGESKPAQSPAAQRPMTDHQRMLLGLFDSLSPEKQLALLTVLKR